MSRDEHCYRVASPAFFLRREREQSCEQRQTVELTEATVNCPLAELLTAPRDGKHEEYLNEVAGYGEHVTR